MPDTLDVVSSELRTISKSLDELKESLHNMRNSMASDRTQVARLEERHAGHSAALERAFNSLTAMESRLQAVELQQPITKVVNKWVLAGILGFVGLSATQLYTSMKSSEKPPVTVVVDRDVIENMRPRAQ